MKTRKLQTIQITKAKWCYTFSHHGCKSSFMHSTLVLWSFISASFVICLNSCTSNASKLQGKWELTERFYDGQNMEDPNEKHIEVEFIHDTLQVFTYPYSTKKDTVKIRIKGNNWMSYDKERKEYDIIATIESLSSKKIVLKFTNEFSEGHVITNTFERVVQPKDFSKEKEVATKKYSKTIVGEWIFKERKSNRYYSDDEWKDYGEPVGWHISFAKDGTGYQIRDSRVVTFRWLIPTQGNTVILTDSKYDDMGLIIIKMTNNTLHLVSEEEEYKLIRLQ